MLMGGSSQNNPSPIVQCPVIFPNFAIKRICQNARVVLCHQFLLRLVEAGSTEIQQSTNNVIDIMPRTQGTIKHFSMCNGRSHVVKWCWRKRSQKRFARGNFIPTICGHICVSAVSCFSEKEFFKLFQYKEDDF